MSHYQGSSYRPGGDSYRPNNRQHGDANGAGYGQGRPGDRGPGMRPHMNGRPPQQGPGFRGNGPNDRRFQGNHNNYTPHVAGNSYNSGHQSQGHLNQGHPNGAGPGFGNLNSHGNGSFNNHGSSQKPNFNNTNYNGRQVYGGNINYKSSHGSNYHNGANYQNGPKSFPPKRATDNYHQAYSQTQAESQIWMGDLDPRWTENDILGIWTEVGEAPINVKIIRDKTGKPQYSFVTFSNQDAVASALQKNRSQIPGSPRFFKLNWASGGSNAESRAPINRARNSPDVNRGHSDYSLFVGDLDTEVTEPELFARFNKDYPGEVKQVKIMMDMNTGVSKGFGFVRFLSVEAQQKALKTMNGILIGQRPIRLGLANGSSQESSTSTLKKSNETSASAVHIAQPQPALTPFTDPNNTKITVKGVISAITRDELVAHFLPFGHLVYCKVDYTNSMAHVKYLFRASAEKALLFMHGFVVNGSRLVLRWGREKPSTEGILRFSPAAKGGSYTAAEKPPHMYGSLPTNVNFEDLTADQIHALQFPESDQYVSVKRLNEADEQRVRSRCEYLNTAF
ncbi:hypothetical protein JCM33374_g5672 [Metschnikowia sp. JCM 33374]|nr:hypothetical protein JCM33374_g5672 [Metschnikowia sp. JCM 33374]